MVTGHVEVVTPVRMETGPQLFPSHLRGIGPPIARTEPTKTQATPTPHPNHPIGLALALLLLLDLYGLVALRGVGTVVSIALSLFGRRIPTILQYLLAGLLVASLGFAAFVLVLATSAGRFGFVAVIALGVPSRRCSSHSAGAAPTAVACASSQPRRWRGASPSWSGSG